MRTTGNPLTLNPKKDWVFCLENLELAFEKDVLERITDDWNSGVDINTIAKRERRLEDEIFLALYHQARLGKITKPFAFKPGSKANGKVS
ncbi:hypothetical protein F9U64_01280 [Gracilibacillus oryzae]|uniref:Uncharacterized protein n=1 Tax=Gracilibacillus oryzae TaxID=1672701 RepID=A0A7C8GVI1_9BACI|nr:hypothetical protein [Gracilibacillus oryzae]KAB8139285.1 hypothetical protein F9U64_01280 [Gracilibacillus oryzae]